VSATSVFFEGPQPVLAEPAAPYPSAQEHLGDELAVCDLQLARVPIVRALERRDAVTSAAPEDGATDRLRALDARIASRREAIHRRVDATARAGRTLPLVELTERFGLDGIGRSAILAAVAVELDASRLAVTGETVSFVTPSILRAALTAPGAISSEAWTGRLIEAGGILAARLLARVDELQPIAPLSAAPLRPAARLVSFLYGRTLLDPRLASCVRVAPPPPAAEVDDPAVTSLLAGRSLRGAVLWLVGPERNGAWELLAASAAKAGRALLELDLDVLCAETPQSIAAIHEALRLEQRLTGALVAIRWRDPAEGPARALALRHLRAIAIDAPGPIAVLGERLVPDLMPLLAGAAIHHVPTLPSAARRALLETHFADALAGLPAEARARLADEIRLGPAELAELARALRLVAGDRALTVEELRLAAAPRMRGRLHRLAELVITPFGWGDLVLSPQELDKLRAIVAFYEHRGTVLTRWNMASKLPYGRGIAALFSGPPGTGKTMAASVIANSLGRELHRVDLSRIVDKYIGETEKNLGAIFDAAAEANAILLFDEADSLFASRTQVRSSNDRYANLETAFLLQRMEQHDGISILTTNLRSGIDEAFLRRIAFKVDFHAPDAAGRAQLWRSSLPAEMPVAGDIDCETLGYRYELSGGHIRAAVLRAAVEAATAGVAVGMAQLEAAAQAACQELRIKPRAH
jgi:hypothetical protein